MVVVVVVGGGGGNGGDGGGVMMAKSFSQFVVVGGGVVWPRQDGGVACVYVVMNGVRVYVRLMLTGSAAPTAAAALPPLPQPCRRHPPPMTAWVRVAWLRAAAEAAVGDFGSP